MSNAACSGFGQNKPPDALTGAAAFTHLDATALTDAPHILVARVECDNAACVEKHAKRGVTHGAFLYALRWGVVEHAGVLLAAVSIETRCHQCGTSHTHIEVPRVLSQPSEASRAPRIEPVT